MASYSGIGGSMGDSDGKARALRPSGGGRSSVVKGKGMGGDKPVYGPESGSRNAGTSRFDLGRSLNRGGRRKMG
jgi:hypothetical protein